MKKYQVHLTREYVVEICAENEDAAKEFTELYVSGGIDDSTKSTQTNKSFSIERIVPTLNEAWIVLEKDGVN